MSRDTNRCGCEQKRNERKHKLFDLIRLYGQQWAGAPMPSHRIRWRAVCTLNSIQSKGKTSNPFRFCSVICLRLANFYSPSVSLLLLGFRSVATHVLPSNRLNAISWLSARIPDHYQNERIHIRKSHRNVSNRLTCRLVIETDFARSFTLYA